VADDNNPETILSLEGWARRILGLALCNPTGYPARIYDSAVAVVCSEVAASGLAGDCDDETLTLWLIRDGVKHPRRYREKGYAALSSSIIALEQLRNGRDAANHSQYRTRKRTRT